ncbi:hypothetical protein BD779DRAFT_1675905 [Infundibulicybe gibba]|nr:hypothetical protein BD779DRAFT_1675905 [Infundibulicybe gibba]
MCLNADINMSVTDDNIVIKADIQSTPMAGGENPGQVTVTFRSRRTGNTTGPGEPINIDSDSESNQSSSAESEPIMMDISSDSESDQSSDTESEPIVIDISSDSESDHSSGTEYKPIVIDSDSESDQSDGEESRRERGFSDSSAQEPFALANSMVDHHKGRIRTYRFSSTQTPFQETRRSEQHVQSDGEEIRPPVDAMHEETLPIYAPIRDVLEEINAREPKLKALGYEADFVQYGANDLSEAALKMHTEFMEKTFYMPRNVADRIMGLILKMWHSALGKAPEASDIEN